MDRKTITSMAVQARQIRIIVLATTLLAAGVARGDVDPFGLPESPAERFEWLAEGPRWFEGRRGERMERLREERIEAGRQAREFSDADRERLRARRDAMLEREQREGLQSAAGFDERPAPAGRRLTPEERRQLRRELNDAARELYGR